MIFNNTKPNAYYFAETDQVKAWNYPEYQDFKTPRALLLLYFDISESTLYLWLSHNSINFSQIGCLEIIINHFECDSFTDLLNINPENVVLMNKHL